MKTLFALFLGVSLAASVRSEVILANVFVRHITRLNGEGYYIVDLYDMGCFAYRHQPYDRGGNVAGGCALERQAKSKSDFIEYNFATRPALKVHGDWNL